MLSKIKINDELLLILPGIIAAILAKELKKEDLEVLGNLLIALGALLATAAAKKC